MKERGRISSFYRNIENKTKTHITCFSMKTYGNVYFLECVGSTPGLTVFSLREKGLSVVSTTYYLFIL